MVNSDWTRLEVSYTTNTGTALTASYTYADDLLTAITTGTLGSVQTPMTAPGAIC